MNVRVFIPVDKAEFARFLGTDPEGRFEYEHGRIVQQMPGTLKHYLIASRCRAIMEKQLDDTQWHVLTDWGVETAHTVRAGDVVVSPSDGALDSRSTAKPALILEVLSPTSIARDLDTKPGEYMSLPSLHAYIVASQSEAAFLVWVRDAAGAFPSSGVEVAGAGQSVNVPSLGITLSLADVYRGLV